MVVTDVYPLACYFATGCGCILGAHGVYGLVHHYVCRAIARKVKGK